MERYIDYDDFAQVYNRHWGGFAIQIMPFLEQLALDHYPVGVSLLDLCCGTGQLARELTERGYRVTGVDGSEQMLRYARRNAPNTTFICSDARALDLPEEFAIIISTYDSLNHLLTLDDVEKVFRNVQRHLKRGGVFVFDMNLDSGFRSRWRETFHILTETSAVLIASKYEKDEKLATMNITIFTQQEEDKALWRRNDVALTQRAYSVEALTEALTAAGFADIEVFDARSDLGMRDEGRAFFRAMKL